MTLRTVSVVLAAAALSTVVPAVGAAPAHADSVHADLVQTDPAHAGLYRNGLIQLTMSKEGPLLGDNNALVYSMHLRNDGQVTATGIAVRVTGWFCTGHGWTLNGCTPLADPLHPANRMDYLIPLASLAPGAEDSFPVTSWLGSEAAGTVRTTVEVVSVDQWDFRSVPGTCVEGWVPQADCVSDVVDLH